MRIKAYSIEFARTKTERELVEIAKAQGIKIFHIVPENGELVGYIKPVDRKGIIWK